MGFELFMDLQRPAQVIYALVDILHLELSQSQVTQE
jgi:hypothetical protein